MNKFLQYLAHKPGRLFVPAWKLIGTHLPDELYLRVLFRLMTGKKLNLQSPETFGEKIQWLKLHDHNPDYKIMVDKYAVKEYVADKLGSKYIIPTLGVWDRVEDIDWDSLPNQFVLKCTHDSGGLVICKDKNKLDKREASKKLNSCLKKSFYKLYREWPYKDVPHRIIAEKYIEDESGELNDYKVFNFGGEPRMIQVDYNRFNGHLRNLYSPKWDRINATMGYPSDPSREFPKPEVLDELLELCKKLSVGIPHVRTDFYIVNNKIYFGEMTFYHSSGFQKITPKEFEKALGDWIILPV